MCNHKQVSPKPDLLQIPFTERDIEASKILISMRMDQSKNAFVNFNNDNKTGQVSISSPSKDAIKNIRTQLYAIQIITNANTNLYSQSHTSFEYKPIEINPSYQSIQTTPNQLVNSITTNSPQAAIIYSSQICSNCKIYGHTIRTCPQLPCKYCGIIGHLSAKCPDKKEERNEAAKASRKKYNDKKRNAC